MTALEQQKREHEAALARFGGKQPKGTNHKRSVNEIAFEKIARIGKTDAKRMKQA